jgi:hypothetical protein
MKVTIQNVEVVSGHILEPYWKNHMQVVHTDQGKCIDTMTDVYHLKKGHEWHNEIGKTIDVYIKENKGHRWIEPAKNTTT